MATHAVADRQSVGQRQSRSSDAIPRQSSRVARVLRNNRRQDRRAAPDTGAGTTQRQSGADAPEQVFRAYLSSSPSEMARRRAALGAQLRQQLRQDARARADGLPAIGARVEGESEIVAQGSVFRPLSLPGTSLDDAPGTDRMDGVQPQPREPGPIAPAPVAVRRQMPDVGDGEMSSRAVVESVVEAVPVRDAHLVIDAGPRPEVALSGAADPARAGGLQARGLMLAGDGMQGQVDQVARHAAERSPVPRRMEARVRPVIETLPDAVPDAGTDEVTEAYARLALPDEVRAQADAMLAPGLEGGLAPVREQVDQAARDRDARQETVVADAQAVARLRSEEADARQRELIDSHRQEVERRQEAGFEEMHGRLRAFDEAGGREREAVAEEVELHAAQKQREAAERLEQGEREAEARKRAEEQRAAREKEAEQRRQQQSGWWSRAWSAIRAGVQALVERIERIFDALRAAVRRILEAARAAAVAIVERAHAWIVSRLDAFRNWLNERLTRLLSDVLPGIAARLARAIDALTDRLVSAVEAAAGALVSAVERIARGLAAAFDRILAAFQTAVTAAVRIAGAVLTGNLADALRIAVQAACDIAGIDSGPIFDFLDRAGQAVGAILRALPGFFENLVRGVGTGIRNFVANVRSHLINGLLGWLTGAMSSVPITLPERLDLRGVFSLVAQILGATYENIKALVIRRYPPAEKAFDVVERGFAILQRVATEGPGALWEMAREQLSGLKDMVLSSIRDFVAVKIVQEGVTWLLGLLNPAGAIVKVVKLLFDFAMFLFERFGQIRDFVMTVYGAVVAIARGQVEQVAKSVEEAIARSLPVFISLLARLAGLGGIGARISKVIERAGKPLRKVVDRLVDRAVAYARRVLGRDKGKKKDKPEPGEANNALGAVSLSDLDRPPVPAKRSRAEMQAHLRRVDSLLQLISERATDTDDIERWFPKLKRRYRLRRIEFDRVPGGRFGVRVAINPEEFMGIDKEVHVNGNDLEDRGPVEFGTPRKLPIQWNGQVVPDQVATSMEYEQLAFDHPQGSATTGAEQKALFSALPTRSADGNGRYIRGHLLNANLGGPANEKNLFPITHQANVDHYRRVEKVVIDKVNRKGYVLYYRVDVKGVSTGEKEGIPYVNADFVCTVAVWKTRGEKLFKDDDKKQTVTIQSRYRGEGKSGTQDGKDETLQLDMKDAKKREDFDEKKVRWARDAAYLSELGEADFRRLGIDAQDIERLRSARRWSQVEKIVGKEKLDELQRIAPRLYRR